MSLPFLPEEEIRPTYLAIHLPLIGLTESELQICATFKSYFSKVWIEASAPSISVFYYEFNTNNGAESYHNCLNSYIKNSHPNVWKFMSYYFYTSIFYITFAIFLFLYYFCVLEIE